MAQLYTTGPAHFYVQFPQGAFQNPGLVGNVGTPGGVFNSQLLYIGTSEAPPKLQLRKANKPVFNDLGGSEIPFDKLYSGEEAYCFADLNRFNQVVMEALQDSPAVRTRPGVDHGSDVGTLWLTEGMALTLYVQFPYARKAAYTGGAGGRLRNGYRFPGAIWEGPEDQAIGTQSYKRMLIFHCMRVFDPATNTFLLYDEVGLAALPLGPLN